jgi:hypothetical protein
MLKHLDPEDPLRGEFCYWLGRSRAAAGDFDAAEAVLLQAFEDPLFSIRSRTFLGELWMSRAKIGPLPYQEGFDDGTGMWVRGWSRGSLDDLAEEKLKGPPGSVLAWSTHVEAGKTDFIGLGIGPLDQSLSTVRMFLQSESLDARVRVVLEDEEHVHWVAPVVNVPKGEWTPVDLKVSRFVQASGAAGVLAPKDARALWVEDVTGMESGQRGPNRLFLDEVELR